MQLLRQNVTLFCKIESDFIRDIFVSSGFVDVYGGIGFLIIPVATKQDGDDQDDQPEYIFEGEVHPHEAKDLADTLRERMFGSSDTWVSLPRKDVFDGRDEYQKQLYSILNESKSKQRTFVGRAGFVKGCLILPIVKLSNIDGDFELPDKVRTDYDKNTSLAAEIANAVAHAMYQVLPSFPSRVPTVAIRARGILREAVINLLGQVVISVDTNVNHAFARASALFEVLDDVSKLTYESSQSVGCISFDKDKDPDVEFTDPVPLIASAATPGTTSSRSADAEPKAIRKLLETSSAPVALLSGVSIKGLVKYCSNGPSTAQNDDTGFKDEYCVEHAYSIRFSKGQKWRLWYGKKPVLEVNHGVPSVPTPRFDAEEFRQLVDETFSFGARSSKTDKLVALVKEAVRQPHGTMVVITTCAKQESERLTNESTSITPTELDETLTFNVTSIDGSLLVDPSGKVHAIGSILDGDGGCEGSNSSRGARHNAAARYFHRTRSLSRSDCGGEAPKCLIVTVSEDGPVTYNDGTD